MANREKTHRDPGTGTRTEQQITLADGGGWDRQNTVSGTAGQSSISTVFPVYGSGWPAFDPDDHAMRLNALIVAVDRPGYGLSDAKSGKTCLASA